MLWLSIDKNSEISITRQLYTHFRDRMLNGEYAAGSKLPSSRELSSTHGISRNVVLEAYDMLLAEGYILSRQGSGMYVAESVSLEVRKPPTSPAAAAKNANTAPATGKPHDVIHFRSGLPALDHFPIKKWAELYRDECLRLHDQGASPVSPASSPLGYGDPAGCLRLREALSAYLSEFRGVQTTPDCILITTGAVQALQLATHALLRKGGCVVIEDPSNYDLQKILSSTGAPLIPLPSDRHGLQTGMLPDCSKDVRVIYLTPSHQFPLGGILPVQRRIELIEYALAADAYIIEDDYDSEYRYEGPPVTSLQSLCPDNVLYIGTLSKTMFPALRIGYMVLPERLVDPFKRLKRHSDYQTPILEQLTLARFIEAGFLKRHISKMRKLYHKRRIKLIAMLDATFGDKCTVYGTSAGLHIVAEFHFEVTKQMRNQLKAANVLIQPVEIHALLRDGHRRQFIIGYGHLDEASIEEGVRRMADVFLRDK